MKNSIKSAINKIISNPNSLILLVLLMIIARSPKFFFTPAFWGEEGNIFYAQQMNLGWNALTTTHAGYLHAYPRLVALIFSWVPVQNIPYVYHLGSLFAHVLLLYALFRFIGDDTRIRALAALSTVILPHNGEAFLNLPNTISVLAPIVTLLYFSEKTSLKKALFENFLIAVVMISGPYGLIQLPLLFVAWMLQGFNRNKISILLTCTVFALVQLAFMDLQVRPPRENPLTLLGLLKATSTFVYYYLFAFFGVIHEVWLRFIIISLGFFFMWRKLKDTKLPKDHLVTGITIIIAGLAIWGAALVKGLGDYLFISPVGPGGRYFWPPYVLTSIGLIYLLKDDANRKALNLFCILVLLSTIPRWASQLPADLTGWREEVLNAPPGPITVRALPSKEWSFQTIKK